MLDYFWYQTNVAALDIDLNIFLETWLIISPANKLFCLIDTEIFCQRVIVVPTDKLCLNDFRYE